MTDNELTAIVRESCPPPEFPLSFNRGVWKSIAVRENRKFSASLNRFISEHFLWLLRPAGAAGAIASMLLLGAGLGGVVSARADDSHLKAAYTASINPIVSAHSTSPP